jgi:NagD protein
VVLGKPDPGILVDVAHRHGLKVEELAMVGDRLYTDIAMAQRAGAISVLVLSGEATAAEAAALATPPDFVLQDVGELGALLPSAQ